MNKELRSKNILEYKDGFEKLRKNLYDRENWYGVPAATE